MGKRAAAPAGAAWKRFRGAGVKSKVNTIVSALRDGCLASEVPESARCMLADGAPAALSTVAENRHKAQIQTCGFILEALQDMAGRLHDKVEEAKKSASSLEAEMESEKARMASATSVVTEAKEVAAKKAEELQQAKGLLADCEQAHAAMESDGVSLKRRRDQHIKEQTKYTDIMEGMLKVLIEQGNEANGSAKEAKKLCDKLMKQVTALGAEPALQASAPSVLLKKPEERQGFDMHVLDSVKGLVTERLESIQKHLDEIATQEAAKAPERAAKAEDVAQAKEQFAQAKQQLEAAEEQACDKEVALVKAQTLLESAEKTVEERARAIAEAEAEAKVFAEVLMIFKELEERSSAPKELEPEEEQLEVCG